MSFQNHETGDLKINKGLHLIDDGNRRFPEIANASLPRCSSYVQ